MISIKNIFKKYKNDVLKSISYEFNNNGLYSIVGQSGSGKSSLLNIISGLDNVYQGNVLIDGVNFKYSSNEEKSKFRISNIGYIFQDFSLLHLLSVRDNVLFNIDSISSLSKKKKEEMVDSVLSIVGLSNKKKVIVNKLSGGEQQRVAIARAIICSPKYLLCDEPTGNLDDKNGDTIFSLLKEYSKNHIVILVSHDLEKVNKYSDEILFIKDGEIKEIKTINELKDNNSPRIKIPLKNKPFLSLSLKIKSGLMKLKEKKFRSMFTNFISSLSLLSLGIGILVGTSLRNQIITSFSSVINPNQILVSKKTNNPNPYTSYIAANEDIVDSIKEDYEKYLYGKGTTYLVNFSSFFPDRNQVYILQGSKKIIINSLSADNFNSYVWEGERVDTPFYPKIEKTLQVNDVVIGLTYVEMVNLCISLQLERSFASLGSYIESHEVRLFLGIDNLSWGYDNDIEFNLVSVYPSNKCEIYHTNNFFNTYVFENEGHLPITYEIESEPEKPWTMKKVFNLHTIEAVTYLIEEVQLNSKYDDVLLESAYNFLDDKCIVDETCFKNLIFVFSLDKNTIDISDIYNFKRVSSSIKSYYLSSNGGYQMHNSGMVEGFVNNLAFSFNEEKIIEVGDYFSKEIEGEMMEFKEVAIGSITRFNNHPVLFSSDLSNLEKGDIPKTYNEIVISSGLANYLNKTINPMYEELYYCYYSKTLDSVISNSFKVVGIVNEDKNYIYHNPLFSSSFFRDRLGISSFNLLPTNMVLNLESGTDINLLINNLESSFKEYNFVSPLNEISKTVDEVMNYVIVISTIFSCIALIVSVLLLALSSYLTIIESKNEINMLKRVGHSSKTIKEYIVSHTFVLGVISTLLAVIELFTFQIFLSLFLNKYFSSSSGITFTFIPFLIVLVVGIFVPILISSIITTASLRKGG